MCLVKPYDTYFLSYDQFTVKNGHNFSSYFCIIFKIHIEETGVLLFHYIFFLTLNDDLGKVSNNITLGEIDTSIYASLV